VDADKVNRWLTLGANVGVFLGIILLIVELDQSRDMMLAQTRNEISQQLSNRLLLVASNSQMASIKFRAQEGEVLTPEEEHQYSLYVVANMRDWENIHYQFRHGTFDQNEFDAEKAAWQYVINNDKSFPKVWCRMRQYYSPEFVAELENLLHGNACVANQQG